MLFRTRKAAAAESMGCLLASRQEATDTLISLCAASEPNCLWPVDIGEPGFLLCWTAYSSRLLPKMTRKARRCFVFTLYNYNLQEVRSIVTYEENLRCGGLQPCCLVHEAQHSYDVLWWARVPVLVSTRWPIFLQTLWRKGPALNPGSKAGPPAGYADNGVLLLWKSTVLTGAVWQEMTNSGAHMGVQNFFPLHLFLKMHLTVMD